MAKRVQMKFKGGVGHFLCIGEAGLHRQDASCPHKHRNVIQRNCERQCLSAFIIVVRVEVIPSGSLRQVDRPGFRGVELFAASAVIHGIGYRTNQQAFPEHVLGIKRSCPGVIGKIKEQTPDHGAVLLYDRACHGINIGHQAISCADRLLQCIVKRIAGLSEVPDFTRHIGSMGAEHREEGAEFKPADIQFPVARVLEPVFVVAAPEPFH